MQEYNQYVTAVNKIFDYLEKMKAGWKSMDNENYIGNIEEYKQIVINEAEKLKKPGASAPATNPPESLEALGNDR
jgi:hypothetical protein